VFEAVGIVLTGTNATSGGDPAYDFDYAEN
jgi:hypothetical protein